MLEHAWHFVASTWQHLGSEIGVLGQGFQKALSSGHLMLLITALIAACAFEFVNGFHDTANAVATVIYTRSLRPWFAVAWSGICNFLGVFIGGTVVAMAIVKLLPADLLATHNISSSLAMVFALLFAAIIWNVGTWYLGLPASSSHTLIGAILGIGLSHAYLSGHSALSGVNWSKASEIALALLISPLIGFGSAALLLKISRRLIKNSDFHGSPDEEAPPPWPVRATLILTSSGVSLAHGSNDGQKGVGLIMIILIAILPAQFALSPEMNKETAGQATLRSSENLEKLLFTSAKESRASVATHSASFRIMDDARAASSGLSSLDEKTLTEVQESIQALKAKLRDVRRLQALSDNERLQVRSSIFKIDQKLTQIDKSGSNLTKTPQWIQVKEEKKNLLKLIDYAPTWVILIVALSLGLGTLVGWKRIVITIGEKIGKSSLTYAQGATAEIVAMGTIGLSALAGLPVSTTHVLSSGVAGTMVANRSGVQSAMIRRILLAWVLTLPASMLLSAFGYWALVRVFQL